MIQLIVGAKGKGKTKILLDKVDVYKRQVYADAEYLAPLIGYTGKVSAEELEELKKEDDSYDATDIVGKTGLESVLETTLQGDKGSETLYVDNMGRTLEVASRVEPVSYTHLDVYKRQVQSPLISVRYVREE